MKRKIKYGIGLSVIILSVLLLVEIINSWVLINPKRYFAHSMEYKEFRVYSDSPFAMEMLQLLDDVSDRMQSLQLYDIDDTYLIFLCNDSGLYKKFANKAGKPENTQGFNLQPLGFTFVNARYISTIRTRNENRYQYNLLEGNLSHIIAHEITHQLIAKRIGYFKARKTESWKLEGYCEYAASFGAKKRDIHYSFTDKVDNYFKGYYDGIPDGQKFYIKGLLMTEYYLDHKNKTFDELMADDISEQELHEELRNLIHEKKL